MANKYDVIVAGAGVAGLTAGCYLSKAGFKVLILENHHKAGGYCTSFQRDGFTFDAGIHTIGSCSKNGIIGRILRDLRLDVNNIFIRRDPSDVVIFPDKCFIFRQSIDYIKEDMISAFRSEEKGINIFFKMVKSNYYISRYNKLKYMAFRQLLEKLFRKESLRRILTVFLANMGLSANKASVLSALVLFNKFVLDGGYYPRNGMQCFSETLVNKYKSLGGNIQFSVCVKDLEIHNDELKSIITSDGEKYKAKNVILACYFNQIYPKIVSDFKPSLSTFGVYLAIDKALENETYNGAPIWLMSDYDFDNVYDKMFNKNKSVLAYTNGILITFPSACNDFSAPQGKTAATILSGAQYLSKNEWDNYRKTIAEKMVDTASKFIPDFKKARILATATPHTFERYTLNYQGAMCGWASVPGQIDNNAMRQKTKISNLFLCGHWSTMGFGQGGVATSMYSGKKAAKLVMEAANT